MSTKAKVITVVISLVVIGTIAYFMYKAGKKAGKKALEEAAVKKEIEFSMAKESEPETVIAETV